MRMPDGVVEIFLQPGEWYFGDRHTRIRTVLGSCVSVVFWHPDRLIGGMCHFVLPSRGHTPSHELDGRYGDEAFDLMLREVRSARTRPEDYRVRLFGGGNMFPDLAHGRSIPLIGQKNVVLAHELVRAHCLRCVGAHVEGHGHRHLLFDIWSGRVTMKRAAGSTG